MIHRIVSFFTSLKLTVACLAMAIVLVFVGTLAQVNLGIYFAQERYFQSLFVYWSPEGQDLRIPVWPGGYLLGGVLLVNLVAAHIRRFEISKKKTGIFLVHAGLILLLLGQLMTELFQVESFMRLEEGETKNYTESGRKNEIAIIDTTDPEHDSVVAIPQSVLEHKDVIEHPDLPFAVRVEEYSRNSNPRLGSSSGANPHEGRHTVQFEKAELTVDPDSRNIPFATVEFVGQNGSIGTWTVSNWLAEPRLIAILREQWGNFLDSSFAAPQTFSYEGRTYRIAMRPVRYYKPYSLQLLDFTHDRYKGTDIPKNFSSEVRLKNPQTGEDREVLIYMNNPLRYEGETYYQGGFEQGDRVSILQVVRNPAWLTPYVSVTIIGIGLLVQFLSHLVAFMKRRMA